VNCQIVQNSLSAYLDRELPGDQMIALRSHLASCPECGSELESLRAVKSGLASLTVHEPRAGLVEDVLRHVRTQDQPTVRVPVGTMVATSVAAAVLAVLAFNLFFGAKNRPQLADEGARFDAASDSAVTSPDFGGHAPLIPVGR
jgi:anti-sigma factor RsiW